MPIVQINSMGEEDGYQDGPEPDDTKKITPDKSLKCKEPGCSGVLELINGAYRCKECWKVYFFHEVD